MTREQLTAVLLGRGFTLEQADAIVLNFDPEVLARVPEGELENLADVIETGAAQRDNVGRIVERASQWIAGKAGPAAPRMPNIGDPLPPNRQSEAFNGLYDGPDKPGLPLGATKVGSLYTPPPVTFNEDGTVAPTDSPTPGAAAAGGTTPKFNFSLGGGGSGGGGGGGGAGSFEPARPSSPEEIDAEVRRTYGYLAGYLQHPEIGPILRQAAQEGWDKARLQGALSATSWWKTTSATARELDAELQLDPATAMAKIEAREKELIAQASQMGLTLQGDITLGEGNVLTGARFLAIQSLRENWSPQELNRRLLIQSAYDVTKQQQGGLMKAFGDDVKRLAADYFLPISTTLANQYAQQIAEGTITMEGIESTLREQAKGRFPGLSDSIDRGVKPAQFFDTYKQQIGSMLELDPDQIDLMSAKWAPVIDTVGSDGARRPMTLSEVGDFVRKTPEWDRTDMAMEQAVRATELLGKTFGVVG